jgi:predicted Rossmann fold nucleotide-binding protein DprA/Smf involved in DNA uptake
MSHENTGLETLIATRTTRMREIEEIDAELERRGFRVTAKPAGRMRDVSLLVLVALNQGPRSSRDVAKATGQSAHACDQMLSKMYLAGEVRRVGPGLYALPRKARR